MAGHIKNVVKAAIRRYNPRSKIYVHYDLGETPIKWPAKLVKDAKNILKTLPSGSYISIDGDTYKTKKGHGRGYPPMESVKESRVMDFIKDVITEEARKAGSEPDLFQVTSFAVAWEWQKKHRSTGDGHIDQDKDFMSWNTHLIENNGMRYEYEDDELYISLK